MNQITVSKGSKLLIINSQLNFLSEHSVVKEFLDKKRELSFKRHHVLQKIKKKSKVGMENEEFNKKWIYLSGWILTINREIIKEWNRKEMSKK